MALILANLNINGGGDDDATGDPGWRRLELTAPLDIAANTVQGLVMAHVFARKDNIMEYACFANVEDVIVEFVSN